MGRPSSYTPEIGSILCERIATGESLRAVCREEGMPSYTSVMRWARDNDEFREHYIRAREDQAHSDADEITDVRNMVLAGLLDPGAAKVVIDAMKWSAGKRAPKVYGDRIAIDGTLDLTSLPEAELNARIAAAAVAAGVRVEEIEAPEGDA